MAPVALDTTTEKSTQTHQGPIQQVSAANLPTNVLNRIFVYLQKCYCCSSPETREYGFHAAWIAATWVCRHWREFALAQSWLWVNIDITARQCDPDAINMLFERAGAMPPSVSLDGRGMDMSMGCALVEPYGRRVSHLSVLFDDSQALSVEGMIMHMGPRLETLQVFSIFPAVVHEMSFDPTIVPNLRVLCVRNIFLHPTSTMHGLRELNLESLWGVMGMQDAHEYLHEVLAACPNLEELDLTDAMPGAGHLDSPVTRVTSLPKLRVLWVNELAIDLPANIASLAIPTSAELSITARYDGCPPEWDDEKTVLPMEVLPCSKFENFPVLAQTRDLALRLGTYCCLPDVDITGGNWAINIPSFENIDDRKNHLPSFVPHVLGEMSRLVVAAQILYLELHVASRMPQYDDWGQLLREFRGVRALTIGGRRAFNGVIEALSADRGAKLLPQLIQLTVCIAAPKNAVTSPTARGFANWLADRAERGKLPESLIVRVPNIPLNDPTIHLAGSLIAYMTVRNARARVVRDTCVTCHGKHVHNLPGKTACA